MRVLRALSAEFGEVLPDLDLAARIRVGAAGARRCPQRLLQECARLLLVALLDHEVAVEVIDVDGGRREPAQEVSWPLDMNRPISRDSVAKAVSFYEE